MQAVPVMAGTVTQKDIPVRLTAIGNVQAYSTVAIRAQVGGQLVRVHFREGRDVRKGDPLFTIDPRPFEAQLSQAESNLAKDTAQLRQAEANLARDLARLENGRAQLRRYEELLQKQYVARAEYDQIRADAEALEATVEADRASVENARAVIHASEASVENARIQVGYTSIKAPMDGRTGGLMIHPGSVVRTNEETPLVIIHQIQPIDISFSLPEQHLSDIKKYRAAGTVRVEAITPDQGQPSAGGELTFVNNAVDVATGTIQLKAMFPNRDRGLWPGQFVQVAVTLTTEPDRTVVPSQAVQAGQQGPYVFVVRSDFIVESRSIVVARTFRDEAVVEKGLAVGETVVTDGQIRLRPGSRVEIRSPEPPPISGGGKG
jgi:multidrug efflux system membrane fusion protein